MAQRKITHRHYGVYGFILNARAEVLVVVKTRGPYTGRYDLPGGSPEEGESAEETLAREIVEETGREILQIGSVVEMEATFAYSQTDCLLHTGKVFLCQVGPKIRQILLGEDNTSAEWLSIETFNTKNATPFLLDSLRLFLQP
ncbi:MAG: NUDIX domain-containing protein [Bacteroidota bacterium]